MLRKIFRNNFEIEKPITRVFPLFTAEGEKLWAPGWDYVQIFGDTNVNEDDVFLTQTHDHAAADAIWIVKKYDSQNHFVQYYKVEPGEKIGLISVTCEKIDDTKTKVIVEYCYTALSSAGKNFLLNFSEKNYSEFIAEWKTLIDAYFSRN